MEENGEQLKEYDIILGWDWADQKHDIYTFDIKANKKSYKIISSKSNAVDEFIGQYSNKKIAIAIEQKRGPIAYMLLKYKNIDIFPINPGALANYRKTFATSHAKNDERDAWLLLDILLKHGESFGKMIPDTEEIRTLNSLNEIRRKSVNQKTALMNELISYLKMYYPQMIDLVDRLDSELAMSMIMKWDNFNKLQQVKENVFRRFCYKMGVRREDSIQKKLDIIKTSIFLTDDKAIIVPLVMRVKTIVSQIRTLNKSIKEFDEKIKEIFDELESNKIFNSLPGAGKSLAPRLACIFGTKINNYPTALDVSTYTGIAPVTESSGKKTWIHWRWNAPIFMRQSLVEFAGQSVVYSEWAKIYYDGMKAKGKRRNAILRGLAFKWVRIIFSCWKNGEEYDEEAYIKTLIKSGSWIGKRLENAC